MRVLKYLRLYLSRQSRIDTQKRVFGLYTRAWMIAKIARKHECAHTRLVNGMLYAYIVELLYT